MIPTVHTPLDDLLQSIEREIMTVGRKTFLYYSGLDLLEMSIKQRERMPYAPIPSTLPRHALRTAPLLGYIASAVTATVDPLAAYAIVVGTTAIQIYELAKTHGERTRNAELSTDDWLATAVPEAFEGVRNDTPVEPQARPSSSHATEDEWNRRIQEAFEELKRINPQARPFATFDEYLTHIEESARAPRAKPANGRAWAYRTLGLPPTATDDEIKLAYRRSVNRINPTVLSHSDPQYDAKVKEFDAIKSAYEVFFPKGKASNA